MKIILSSRRHHYAARVSIFLIAVALIAGMVGCGGGGVEYDLTIDSTAGGSVTIPEEGTSTYDEGEVVNLVAEAEEGYQFVSWTGDVDDIANVEDATTTITMNGDYTVSVIFIPTPPPSPVSISNILATPTKIGNAAVITWDTNVTTTNNIVVYDQLPNPSTPSSSSPGLDNVYRHAVVISGLTPNSTYYYRVRVTYGEYVFQSDVYTFIARNARNAWDSSVNKYTVNMLITLNWDVTSTYDGFLTTWFTSTNSYMAQAAQDIYDATDGYIRLGTVIVVDNQQKGNALWQTSDMTFEEDDPATPIDEGYQSYGGSTPYTYNDTTDEWMHTPAIENATGGVGMQFGRMGAARNETWSWYEGEYVGNGTRGNDYQPGWQARIITHEFGHYALYLPDRYDENETDTCVLPLSQETCLLHWDQNITWDCDLMSSLGYWSYYTTFRYYTEFAGYACDDNGDSYFSGSTPLNITDRSSWYIIINPDPFANSRTPHYTNAHYVPAQGRGVEPAYPDVGPTNENGGVFNIIFINN